MTSTHIHKHISFIGAGNMAKAMIGGLLQQGFPETHLHVTTSPHSTNNTIEIANQADVLIFAVKPIALKSVVTDLKSLILTKKPLLISIAAGVSTSTLYHWLDDTTLPLIRAMPNTPALINQAVTGVFTPAVLSVSDLEITQTILSAIGSVIWLAQENWLDIVTGLSGSGPGFIFYIIEAMVAQAVTSGLPEPLAKELALKTCLGSAALALSTDQPLALLREKVTSIGGTTFAGLQKAESLGLAQTIQQMVAAAIERANTICQQTH